MKSRIAIITPGGISAGINAQGFPALMQIVIHLSQTYQVDVFTQDLPAKELEFVRFHSAPRWLSNSILRWGYLKLSLLKNLFRNNYDLLISFWGYPSGTIAVAFGLIFKKPSIVFLLGGESANVPSINYGMMRKAWSRKIILWTCRNATQLITLSNYQIENLKKYGVSRNVEVIPFGSDLNLFRRSNKKLSEPLQMIHVANLNPVKDQFTLIRSFQIIRSQIQARLTLVGPDFMNGKIQSLVKELGLDQDIEFKGWLEYKEIANELGKADCFILTSLSEAQNDSITEAMTCGLLPISTRVGVMADLGDEFGIVDDVGDYQSLAQKVVSLFKNPEEWTKKAVKAHAWALEHDLRWTLNQIVLQIEFALKQKPNEKKER